MIFAVGLMSAFIWLRSRFLSLTSSSCVASAGPLPAGAHTGLMQLFVKDSSLAAVWATSRM